MEGRIIELEILLMELDLTQRRWHDRIAAILNNEDAKKYLENTQTKEYLLRLKMNIESTFGTVLDSKLKDRTLP